jgi:hypothetical protein
VALLVIGISHQKAIRKKSAHIEASSDVLTTHEGQPPGQGSRPFSTRRLAQSRPRFQELLIFGINMTSSTKGEKSEEERRMRHVATNLEYEPIG